MFYYCYLLLLYNLKTNCLLEAFSLVLINVLSRKGKKIALLGGISWNCPLCSLDIYLFHIVKHSFLTSPECKAWFHSGVWLVLTNLSPPKGFNYFFLCIKDPLRHFYIFACICLYLPQLANSSVVFKWTLRLNLALNMQWIKTYKNLTVFYMVSITEVWAACLHPTSQI